jgi:hypothetical protein
MGNSENIDDILAQFQAEYRQKSTSSKPSQPNSKPDNSLDDALAQIEKDLKDETPKPLKKERHSTQSDSPAINNLLNNLKTDFAAKKTNADNIDISFPTIQQPQQNKIEIDNLLNQIKTESQKQMTIAATQSNTQNIAAIQQQELNAQKQRRLNLQQAETWLKNLDPNSEEWLWFEQFAYSYESKVEAAIDYLKALGRL